MANLTINVHAEALKRARIRALEENTSVNAVLGIYLQQYAKLDEERTDRKMIVDDLLQLARKANTGSSGRKWTREELYGR